MLPLSRSTIKLVLLLAAAVISITSGALIHVYANGSGEEPANSVSGLAAAADGSKPGSAKVQIMVDVCPGDTLWRIAADHLPKGESVRSYIYKIKKANGLKSADIKAGQSLVLP